MRLISTLTKEFINFYLGAIFMYEKGPYTVIANWDQSFSRDGGSGLVYCFHFPQHNFQWHCSHHCIKLCGPLGVCT